MTNEITRYISVTWVWVLVVSQWLLQRK